MQVDNACTPRYTLLPTLALPRCAVAPDESKVKTEGARDAGQAGEEGGQEGQEGAEGALGAGCAKGSGGSGGEGVARAAVVAREARTRGGTSPPLSSWWLCASSLTACPGPRPSSPVPGTAAPCPCPPSTAPCCQEGKPPFPPSWSGVSVRAADRRDECLWRGAQSALSTCRQAQAALPANCKAQPTLSASGQAALHALLTSTDEGRGDDQPRVCPGHQRQQL